MKEKKHKSQLPHISLKNCRKGFLYKLRSRNLSYGVYDGEEGFIGIRCKFRSRYLFTEYHWEQGPPFGTVLPLKKFCQVPSDIELRTAYPETLDSVTGREVEFDNPVSKGGKGWFFCDTGESSEEIRPYSRENSALFDWLVVQEESFEE